MAASEGGEPGGPERHLDHLLHWHGATKKGTSGPRQKSWVALAQHFLGLVPPSVRAHLISAIAPAGSQGLKLCQAWAWRQPQGVLGSRH